MSGLRLFLNEKELQNANITEAEKAIVKRIINIASLHDGASPGEIAAFKFLCSLGSECEVDMGDVLYHVNFIDIITLLKIQASGVPISNFWSEKAI